MGRATDVRLGGVDAEAEAQGYLKTGNGRQPLRLETIRRIYFLFLQQ